MGTRKFGRDDHHHKADAHLDAAAVTPSRTLLCPVTEASTVSSTMPSDTEVIATGPEKKKKEKSGLQRGLSPLLVGEAI